MGSRDPRPLVQGKALDIGLTLVVAPVTLVALGLNLSGDLANAIGDHPWLAALAQFLVTVVVPLVLLFAVLLLLFRVLPDARGRLRQDRPRGCQSANSYGLRNMTGNVWEWCADWFVDDYYAVSPADDPNGPAAGTHRVMCGGSYLCHASYCSRYRVDARSATTPDSSTGNLGFRVAGEPVSRAILTDEARD